MNIIEQLKWRYATKNFDKTKKLTVGQLHILLESVNLSASSYGMQPFEVMVIENQDLKDRLRIVSGDQSQVSDASQLILFAARNNLSPLHVEEYMQRIMSIRNVSYDSLSDYRNRIVKSISSKSQETLLQWASRQIYIALGFLLVTAAVEEIDACPIEGFEKEMYDEILGLKEKGLSSVVMAAVGYRSADDKYQFKPKVRKSIKELITFYN
jgi:nitroreductase / dihydropteridine reductase